MNDENMNDQEINIAIAEACPTIVGLGADGIYYLRTGLVEFDPCNDLNAMHEVENWMMANKSLMHFWKYAERLKKYFLNLGEDGYIHATARQRAEAFLRTIGKWKEVAK